MGEVHMDEAMRYEPLVITAHTPAGFASSDPWSPSLDGILAYWALREQLGEEEFGLGMSGQREPVEAELPLERVGDGPYWFWAVSSPIYHGQGEFLHHYHRRFDAQAAERFLETGRSGRVATSAGPYKAYRQAHLVHVAPSVSWHAIGDAAEIERLLSRCSTIGAGGTRGLGMVRRWTVETGGDPNLARRWRPLPQELAGRIGVEGALLEWAVRPPGWARRNRCLCVMPISQP
jgi:CRISPR type IV-associated protein Csf3